MSSPSNERNGEILETVGRYYSEKLGLFGATARGVDWNSEESQLLRFEQLLRLVTSDDAVSLLDYGCGYGALLDYLRAGAKRISYVGYDVSTAMVDSARMRHHDVPDCAFTSDQSEIRPVDYAVASGIFNVKLQYAEDRWRDYVEHTLESLNSACQRGFAFNMLSTLSDPARRRSDLYYSDPVEMFDFCKRRFSPRLALLHDYPLFEFTMIVRK